MAAVGSIQTRLVVLRGDSGSGKTTTALALRPHLGPTTALIHQDLFRRELLAGRDRRARAAHAAAMIDSTARQALDLGYDVILDGIFNLRDYADRLEGLWRDHRGRTRIYQYDVGFEETVRRHGTRSLRSEFGPEELSEWYDGWQPLPFVAEHRVTVDVSVEQLVDRILADLRGAREATVAEPARPDGEAPNGSPSLRWRDPITDAEMLDLVRSHGGVPAAGWWDAVQRHSLGWVAARDAERTLVGFVNVAWDGGDHAFLLDTKTRGTEQRRGIATRVVALAAEQARLAGCEWLHVDFQPSLRTFYLDACGFRPTEAGLIRLRP